MSAVLGLFVVATSALAAINTDKFQGLSIKMDQSMITLGKKGDVKIVRTGPKQASVVADKVDVPYINAEKISAKSINLGGSDLLNLIKTMQAKIDALTATVEKLTAKTCLKGTADSQFWPTQTKAPSPLGVVLHTHKPNHMAYRIPAKLFSTLPKGWFAKDGQVHFYCNENCNDSGSPGGCTARDGGILSWPDDMKEDKSFRKCLLESVARQGGVWKKDTFCVVGLSCKNGELVKASTLDNLCSKCNKGYFLSTKSTCEQCLKGTADSQFWPTKTKAASPLGVVLHTHKPNHMAYRIPAKLFSTLPKGWFAKDGQVHFYCNENCNDSGSPGGCTARDGGILSWPDDMKEDKSFRKCLLESVARQGGVWKDIFCVGGTCKNGDAIKASAVDGLCSKCNKGYILNKKGTCDKDVCSEGLSSTFWPTKTKTPSKLGVVLHTHKPNHIAYRVPSSLFSKTPKGWYAKDNLFHFYCNDNCKDSGSKGGCTARTGGILSWPDDMPDDKKFRACLVASVKAQGGAFKENALCFTDPCDASVSDGLFWPTKTKTPSAKGVVLHTHKPNHIAWRIPAKLFSTLPKGWFAKDGQVHFYCNENCKDSGSPGGCTARDGGILSWPDDLKEDKKFRNCLLASVQKQGGVWKKDAFSKDASCTKK